MTTVRLHFSCDSSMAAGEPLFATAPRTDTWLLLEHDANWGAKALDESDLAQPIKDFLNGYLSKQQNGRFQFIKQPGRMGGIRFYVVQSGKLYRFDLADYEDLVGLDLDKSIADAAPVDEKLFLVCTNGKRDACCSRHGLPLYQAMRQAAGEAVWQTSHIGGHRFAGTLVSLPRGHYYGRVSPSDAVGLVEAEQREQVLLSHLRGRCTDDSFVQAAEYFLREQTGIMDCNALRVVGVESVSEDRWQARFADENGTHHTVIVRQALSEIAVYESTTDADKKQQKQFYLDSYERG
ncbi:MAG: hypothetical protein K8L97_25235 [Anaerolineae bacterium]|nr:hypothetical protein [Anaerolineae bacterium]